MVRKRVFLILIVLFGTLPIFGQTQMDAFQRAVYLYKQGQYGSAYTLFEALNPSQIGSDPSAAASYKLLCQIALDDPGMVSKTAEWEALYPGAPLRQLIYFQLGLKLINKEDYQKAIAILSKITPNTLAPKEYAKALFFKGYAQWRLDQKSEALHTFSQVEALPQAGAYKQAAQYYHGYLLYSNRQFKEAIPLLLPLRDSPKHGQLASSYLIQSYFYLKDYNQAVAEGERFYATADSSLQAPLAKLLSESFFALGRKQEARTYFDAYIKQSSDFSRTDRYYSGILYFGLGEYNASADQLQVVGAHADSLGQNALFHLGEAYVALKNKVAAMDAFRRASQMPFDPTIKEEAFYNYAKLSFDVNGDVSVLSTFRNEYPNSPQLDEIQTYIAAHAFLMQDYAAAVEALQVIPNPSAEIQDYLKRAAYLRGMQLYQAGSYREAETFFSLSNQAYWVAECLYRSHQLSSAITIWKQCISPNTIPTLDKTLTHTCYYNIAYAYFKQDNFEEARKWFEKYTAKKGNVTADAYLRLGDCAFVLHDYPVALEAYQKAIDAQTIHPDYAAFQAAMVQGAQNDATGKLATLAGLMTDYPTSAYVSAALYEQGRTYVQDTQYDLAESCFQRILSNDTHLSFQAKSLVELGLIRINADKPDEAMAFYKEVIQRFPDSPEAPNALAGIENIYLSRNDSKGFFAYTEKLGLDTGKTADEKEQMLFTSAEQLYLTQAHSAAVPALRHFIADYPQSASVPAAHFYLGECLVALNKKQEAADAYLAVMEAATGSFTELAIRNYASIQYDFENYGNAVDAYLNLLDVAVLENNHKEAIKGLMWSYYKDKKFQDALLYAQRVQDDLSLPEDDRKNATFIRAKSHLALGEREQAEPLLEILAKEPQNAIGAEAYFLLCKAAFDAGNFDLAENTIYNFADTETPQEYWIARAYILLGDLFSERNEWVQAKATYESVQNGYNPSQPDDIAALLDIRIKKCEEHL